MNGNDERSKLINSFQGNRRTGGAFLRKPIPVVDGLERADSLASSESRLERHLSLFDLAAIGVGGTIGSGLFVLSGLVSHDFAGPSAIWSWGIAGIAALISGCCYAELSGRIPLPGGAYAYSSVGIGEWPAYIAAVCLSVEYISAGAAIARSWGDKLGLYLLEEVSEPTGESLRTLLNIGGIINPLGFLISTACVWLVLAGVKESKRATNFFTTLKLTLVTFMILVGSLYIRPSNWTPMFPYGASGMFRGATATFFGYLGFDQVCVFGGEATNPKRDMPLAVMCTLVFVALVYMTATAVLTGMQAWSEVSSVAGFPSAFYANGAHWAGEITALGEIVTLPLVVLVQVVVQPRLQFAMAEDGLLPAVFGELDQNGNMWKGTCISGTITVVLTTVVPFTNLNDVVSCAALMALNVTDSSLLLLWHEAPNAESGIAHRIVLLFHVSAIFSSILLTWYLDSLWGQILAAVMVCAMGGVALGLNILCPRAAVFGGTRQHYLNTDVVKDASYFRTPLVPFLPCLGIFINWYLLVQLDLTSIGGFGCFLCVISIYYATRQRRQ